MITLKKKMTKENIIQKFRLKNIDEIRDYIIKKNKLKWIDE